MLASLLALFQIILLHSFIFIINLMFSHISFYVFKLSLFCPIYYTIPKIIWTTTSRYTATSGQNSKVNRSFSAFWSLEVFGLFHMGPKLLEVLEVVIPVLPPGHAGSERETDGFSAAWHRRKISCNFLKVAWTWIVVVCQSQILHVQCTLLHSSRSPSSS